MLEMLLMAVEELRVALAALVQLLTKVQTEPAEAMAEKALEAKAVEVAVVQVVLAPQPLVVVLMEAQTVILLLLEIMLQQILLAVAVVLRPLVVAH
jgi:hypothetical protein